MEKIGERIKRLREEKGMTQEFFAQKTNYDQSAISKIETGRQDLNGRNAPLFAKALGITLDDLIAGTDGEFLKSLKTPASAWENALERLPEVYPGDEFLLTTCFWCGESTPSFKEFSYTTLCSWECAAEVRYLYKHMGWPLDEDFAVTPLLGNQIMDNYGLLLAPPTPDAINYDLLPNPDLKEIYNKNRYNRGPLRDRLLLERPELKAVIRGGVPTKGRKDVPPGPPYPAHPTETNMQNQTKKNDTEGE